MILESGLCHEETVDLDQRDCPMCYQRLLREEMVTEEGYVYSFRYCDNCDWEEDVDDWDVIDTPETDVP